MPSPIAHAVTGYCLGQFWRRFPAQPALPSGKTMLGIAVWSAIAADIDFIPQLLSDLSLHRGITHSLGVGILSSVIVSGIFARQSRKQFLTVMILALVSYGSHLFLDLLTAGGSGIPVFWPITNATIQLPWALFPQVHHSEGLFYRGHVLFLFFETAYAALILLITHWSIRFHRKADIRKASKSL
ncbi:metal-dependent hydrolase [Oscillatoria sp. CS-180]|uniref:metal-dependent hydrolase n=1 Tax=Oscillatoria sp. CS-180 TaxID=3021720 RepID=UPI00232C5112|nr:metal-dependent hydrolase [Oscillatoria sp. CS-180]MDB9526587.1 metal-dependent hydrolase [Oscillatoria sp. CS-180]